MTAAGAVGPHLGPFDALVTQRLALPTCAAIDEAVAACRARGAKFIYDLDDDLLALGDDHPDLIEFKGMERVVRYALACADQVWVSTPELRTRVRSLAHQVVVVPNALDPRIWKPRERAQARDDRLRILYMGTRSHRQDFFDLLEPAFRRLAASASRPVSLHVVGVLPPELSNDLWSVISPPAFASCYPAFVHWLQSLEQFHVGVAPLRDNRFNRAKSELKWLEYSAIGAATIAADLPPYSSCIQHGVNGLLCSDSPSEWCEAILQLMEDAEGCVRHGAAEEIRNRLQEAERREPRATLIASLVSGTR